MKNDNLNRAKVQLLLRQPFFASLLLKKEIRIHKDTEYGDTACVDKQGVLHFHEKFLDGLTVNQIQFVLAHEVMHVVYAHLARLQDRDPELWNVACDAVINDLLERERVGEAIEDCIRMPGAADRTAEDVYAELLQKQKQQKQGRGGSAGNGGAGGTKNPMPDLKPELAKGMSKAEIDQAITEGKVDVASAVATAKMAGKLSSGLAQRFEKFLESKTPWFEILERFMTAHVEQHHSWNRPNKRYLRTAYLPRRERLPGMGEVVIQIDTSGSLTDETLGEFKGHVARIIEQCRPEKVHLLFTTTDVVYSRTFEQGERLEFPSQSWCGGTDMMVGLRWAEKNAPEAELAITLTDGYTPFDECDIPTVWVYCKGASEEDAPIGDTIRI